MPTLKTVTPIIHFKKKINEEIVGKYYNMEAHKVKVTPNIKNSEAFNRKLKGQLESLGSYSKNISTMDEVPKPALAKKCKLSKIDEELLSSAAKQLPQIIRPMKGGKLNY